MHLRDVVLFTTTLLAQATTFTTPRDLLIITGVCAGTAVVMWLAFRSAGPIARRLGPIGLNVVDEGAARHWCVDRRH